MLCVILLTLISAPRSQRDLAAENLARLYHANYGVPTVSLRYFTVYGPRQRPDMAFHRFMRAAVRGEQQVRGVLSLQRGDLRAGHR